MRPLYPHDKRLDYLKVGQYRIWYDGQNILVPVGQSITKPLTKEIVNANTKVDGEIHNGFFQPPLVSIENTDVCVESFDRFFLGIWREGSELPKDDPRIDFHYDIGLNELYLYFSLTLRCDTFYGEDEGLVILKHINDNNWKSDIMHFNLFELDRVYGDYYFVTNPSFVDIHNGLEIKTGLFLQDVNLPLSIIITKAALIRGNSEMDLLLYNSGWDIVLNNISINIKGGK